MNDICILYFAYYDNGFMISYLMIIMTLARYMTYLWMGAWDPMYHSTYRPRNGLFCDGSCHPWFSHLNGWMIILSTSYHQLQMNCRGYRGQDFACLELNPPSLGCLMLMQSRVGTLRWPFRRFLQLNGLAHLVRAHQLCMTGYQVRIVVDLVNLRTNSRGCLYLLAHSNQFSSFFFQLFKCNSSELAVQRILPWTPMAFQGPFSFGFPISWRHKKKQVLFDDSLSTVWSAPNYCIQAAHPDGVFGERPKDDPIAEQCSKSRLIGSETSR